MRLTKSQLKKLYNQYHKQYNGNMEAIAKELAEDFIYNAQLEFDNYLNTQTKKFDAETFRKRGDLRVKALYNQWEFMH